MANPGLFGSRGPATPPADTTNQAGGLAYQLTPKHALAQLAATGFFSDTYYADAQSQLDSLLTLVAQVDDDRFLARLAIYSRQRGKMKDMPAALLAVLSVRAPQLFETIFSRVADTPRVLRTFVQMIRSGQFGRRSLSHAARRQIEQWCNSADYLALLNGSVGQSPSLRDILRLAHPRPANNARRAVFGWLTGRSVEHWQPASQHDLPSAFHALDAYLRADSEEGQMDVLWNLAARWDLLADKARGPRVWRLIARKMGLQALRMNLNTLLRQRVFDEPEMVRVVAERLSDPKQARESGQLPYQWLAAYLHADPQLPQAIRGALHRAAEVACGNVPSVGGPLLIGVDVSGSMADPISGKGTGHASKMRCVDVAALAAVALFRANPDSQIVPFDHLPHECTLDPADSILSLAERLAKFGGGGTNCAIPLAQANVLHRAEGGRGPRYRGCVLISDNQSWIDAGQRGITGVLSEWETFVAQQVRLQPTGARPKLVCLDLAPNSTSQAQDRGDILNIGGFSDAVFDVIAGFFSGDDCRFVSEVEAVALDQ